MGLFSILTKAFPFKKKSPCLPCKEKIEQIQNVQREYRERIDRMTMELERAVMNGEERWFLVPIKKEDPQNGDT